MDELNNCKHATVVCSFSCEEREWEVHFKSRSKEITKVEWVDTLILSERIDKSKINK